MSDEKKIKGYKEVRDKTTNDLTGYEVQYDDGTTVVVPPGDPSLTQSIPAAKYFIREVKKGEFGDGVATFELSPVDNDVDVNKIMVQVKTELPDGSPDPRYEQIISVISKQKHDFINMELARDITCSDDQGNDVYRVIRFGELPDQDYSVYYNEETKQWKQTDSKVNREFTYTNSLQEKSDAYGQWRIAESHLNTISMLRESQDQFGHLCQTAKRNMLQHQENKMLRDIMEKKGYKELDTASETLLREKIKESKEYTAMSKYFDAPVVYPSNLDVLLEGREIEQNEKGESEPKAILYDLDLPIENQLTPVDLIPDEESQLDSTHSQMYNYFLQKQLRHRMKADSQLGRVFLRANQELVEDEIIPIADPYREDKEFLLLNGEYSEMIGSNILAALMTHQGAKPNQFMKGFAPGEAIDRLLHGLNYEEQGLDKLTLEDLIKVSKDKLQDVLQNQKNAIIEIAETEAYAPGKSPKAKTKAAKEQADEANKQRAIAMAVGAAATESVIDASTVGFFR